MTSDITSKSPPSAALVFCLCFAPRVLYLLWNPPAPEPGFYYWDLADSLLRDGTLALQGQATTAFEPLYPLFLAGARWLTGDRIALVLLLQIAIACLGGVLFAQLCLRLTESPRVAWVGAVLYALDPYAIHQSVRVMEVVLLSTLLIAVALAFCRLEEQRTRIASARGALLAGTILGVTLLSRAAAFPVLIFALVLLVSRRKVAEALCVALAALLLVAPLAARNHSIDGSLLFSRSGENLFIANNPLADDVIPEYNTDLLGDYIEDHARRELKNYETASDHDRDRYFSAKALRYVLDNPLDALQLKLENAVTFFEPRVVPYFPLSDATRLVIESETEARVEDAPLRQAGAEIVQTVFWSLVLVGFSAGAWLRRSTVRNDAFLYLMLLAFLLVCIVYFPATRLRAPVEFVPMFFAAVALARCLRRV